MSRIQQIVPAFSEHAEAGDVIHLGLEGDDYFPATYRGNRPELTVVRKELASDGSYDIVARDNSTQEEVMLRGNSGDPRWWWECSDGSFEEVLAREGRKYRGAVETVDTGSLEERISKLERDYRSALQETTRFKNAAVEAMSEIAREVSGIGNAPFSRMLHNEYRGSMNQLTHRASVLDDYSSSSDED